MELLQDRLPRAQAGLDSLAAALVEKVNALHSAGYNAAGESGLDFFDPGATDARHIGLAAAVGADATRIAASSQPGAASDNRNALALAGLRDAAVSYDGLSTTFGGHYEALVSDVALDVNQAGSSADLYGSVTAQVDNQRQSVSGVSTDEELMHLMQYQQAYTAAARVVSTVDQLFQTLLDIA